MKIRTRLALWYTVIMFASLAAMGLMTYREFAPGPNHLSRHQKEDPQESDSFESVEILLTCGIPSAILALAGGWWLIRRAFMPVARLAAAAAEANEGNLGRQLPLSGNDDELDRLTALFNGMTTRLNGAFQRVREFTLNASHELKTPLTIMHGEVETVLDQENLSPKGREKLLSQLDEIQRLSKIVDGLTFLTKADAGQVRLTREIVPLNELVREMFEDTQILAQASGLKVNLGACEPLKIRGDRHRLRQVLLNLADNAVKHNVPKGSVALELRRVDTQAELTITNTSAGIASDKIPLVFDRFFRGDAAHGRADDGCGLGLSIAQWITQAHDGTIALNSTPGASTVVTLRLPLAAD